MMKKLLITIVILIFFCSFLQDSKLNEFQYQQDDTLTLIFVGDVMGHSPQFKAAYNANHHSYNYNDCFRFVKDYISDADLAIANLETTFSGMPYTGYPAFSSPDELADGMKNAGFDIILLANNHIYDKNRLGFERTINVLSKKNFLYVGSYKSKSDKDSLYPLTLDIKNNRISILNYTYSTNNPDIEFPNIVNILDSATVLNDIQIAKIRKSDLIFFTAHWGNEYQLEANEEIQNFSRFLNLNGVDLIIGSHPHVVQNGLIIENALKTTPVLYSLGNFISNQRNTDTNGGIMFKVKINTRIKKIVDTSFLPVYVYKGKINNHFQFYLIPTPDFICHPFKYKIPVTDSLLLTEFDKRTRERLSDFKVDSYFITKN